MFKTLAITAIVAVAHAANLEWGNAYKAPAYTRGRNYYGYGSPCGYGAYNGYGGYPGQVGYSSHQVEDCYGGYDLEQRYGGYGGYGGFGGRAGYGESYSECSGNRDSFREGMGYGNFFGGGW